MSADEIRIAVMGGGLMGRQHILAIERCDRARLSCIIDPFPVVADLAAKKGVPFYADIASIPEDALPDAVIIATPNQLHEEHAIAVLSRGVAALVEKPISDDADAARRMIRASETAGAPLLVGYHRRHSPVGATAKAQIESGALGQVLAVQSTCWLFKPDDYFDVEWRKKPGGGPLNINLVHDVDLMIYLLGAVSSVQAITSDKYRGFEVEDTAGVVMQFESGAIATLSISDTIVAPWSYELTAGENPAYPQTGQSSYLIGGTKGALEMPAGRLWRNPGKRGWWEEIGAQDLAYDRYDPLTNQVEHLCAVVRKEVEPKVTGQDGLMTLLALAAIRQSAETGQRVAVDLSGG